MNSWSVAVVAGLAIYLSCSNVLGSDRSPALAIMGAGEESLSPELAAVQQGVVHLLQSELSVRSASPIVSRSRMSLFLDELGMATAELVEPETAQRYGHAISADYLVLVRLTGGGQKLTATISVEQVETGQSVWHTMIAGSATQLPQLADALAEALIGALGLPQAGPAEAALGPPPTLAVLDFRSEGAPGKLDRHLVDLADLLSANLTALSVPLVERQRLSAVLEELGLSASGLIRAADMAKVGKLLGAGRALDTSMILSGPTLVFDSQLIQPETGLVTASCRVSADEQHLPAAVQQLAIEVAQALRLPLTDAGRRTLSQQATGSTEAALHAAAGWRLGGENRPEDAVRELQQAVYLDPALASAWWGLAQQYRTLEDYQNWADCARRFFGAAQGKADPETFAAMAGELANAEMWQGDFAGEEAAARLGLRYAPDDDWLHERLIIALARQGKAKEVLAHCEDVYRRDEPPYGLTYSVFVYAIHWLGYGGDRPAEEFERMADVEFQTISRGLDIFDQGVPSREFRFGIVMRHALVQACGAMVNGGAGILLAPPLQHAQQCLSLARRMTTYSDRPWTSGRGWFVVGLIEYKLGNGKEAEAALLRCLTYPNVNYDFDSYGYLAPDYGLVYYLLGHTYQDLLSDRERAIAAYQQACFWLIPDWEAAHDSRAQLSALGSSPTRTDWHHTVGTCGPILAKTYREQLITWLPAHGYYLGFQYESQEVQRREEGIQLLPWEGRRADVPTADDLRAYVAGGGSLFILLPPQAYNDLVPPVMSGSAESLDVTLDWLLPAFGLGLSHHISSTEEPAPLLPAQGPPLALDDASYTGTYFLLEVPESMSLLRLQLPGQRRDTVAAVGVVGLGKVAVVSLQEWFPAQNVYLPMPPAWQAPLMQGIMDWLSAPAAGNQLDAARHWGVARNLVSLEEYGTAVQELDQVARGAPSGADARYWAGCVLADKLGNIDAAAQRWREVIADGGADTWLTRMAHLRLGTAAVRAGDERTAAQELALAAGEVPDGIWGQAWVAGGDLKLAQGDYLAAAQAFRKVADELGHCEERFRALFGLAYALDREGKPEAAARVYEALVVEFGKAPLPPDVDVRWPDPWEIYYPPEVRGDQPTVADVVTAARRPP